MIEMEKKYARHKTAKIQVVDVHGNVSYINSVKEASYVFDCTPACIYVALKRGTIRGCKISRVEKTDAIPQ